MPLPNGDFALFCMLRSICSLSLVLETPEERSLLAFPSAQLSRTYDRQRIHMKNSWTT